MRLFLWEKLCCSHNRNQIRSDQIRSDQNRSRRKDNRIRTRSLLWLSNQASYFATLSLYDSHLLASITAILFFAARLLDQGHNHKNNMDSMSYENHQIRLSDQSLTKEERAKLIRTLLPGCQPQEGSPANTFTASEIDQLQKALPNMQIGKKDDGGMNNKIDIMDMQWQPPQQDESIMMTSAPPQDGSSCMDDKSTPPPQDCPEVVVNEHDQLDWHGAPRFHSQVSLPRSFRQEVRAGRFTSPTNGVCPGFLQCNLVVLPQGKVAFDFLLFCQRNPKACPLIEVCDAGSPFPKGVAPGADLRTDVPK